MSHSIYLIKAPLALLESMDRDGAKAHSAAVKQCEQMCVDQGWEADLRQYAFAFSHVLDPEGSFKDTDDGVEMGYVTPRTVQTRAEELAAVDIEVLYKKGLFQEFPNFDMLDWLKKNLADTLKFHQEAAQAGLGLIIKGIY